MQSYPFEFEGKEYELKRLTREVKNYITDRMTAERLSGLTRLLAEKLISEKDYVLAKANAIVRWNSPEFANDIVTEEYAIMFIRQLLKDSDKIDDDTLNRMAETESFQAAMKLCHEDSEPKKRTGA